MRAKAEQEIERKFVARLDPSVMKTQVPSNVVQAYLSRDPMVRVCIASRRPTPRLTIKHGHGLERTETSIQIPDDALEPLMASGYGGIIKTRYFLDRWEVDVFLDFLDGLCIAEIELSSVEEPLPPIPPGLRLLKEVTYEEAFENAALAELSEEDARAMVTALYEPY